MSAEGATALFERVTSDEELRSRLEAASTPEDKRQIVTEAGFDVSRLDLPFIRDLAGIEELSDEDLEKVAGGTGSGTIFAAVAGGTSGMIGIGVLIIAAVAV